MKSIMLLAAIWAAAIATPACAVGRIAQVTVYDRSEGRQLPVHWHEGRAWIAGKPGNEYRVSLRNRGNEELLAVVSIDGVNVITGETANPAQSGYLLAALRRLDIAGWRKSLAQTAAFYFTALPDSYAARTGRPGEVGVIGIALFRKKPFAPLPPVGIAPLSQAESRKERASAGAAGDARASADAASGGNYEDAARLGTGHGRRETSPARYVEFERADQAPAETITLYYDSRPNLIARGVIREATPRLPNPFPGFVADPQARRAPAS
ncbi:MAG: hypothetical protein OEW21_10380 [Betaproteobacteria bacterium]|nr:hypothetical protein [Betaproteobacteria bacterium]